MPDGAWTRSLWDDSSAVFDAILAHPFLTGLADGTLEPVQFAYFLAQDERYLRDFGQALGVLAGKAVRHADVGLLARCAAGTAEAETGLHERLLPQLGIDADTPELQYASPTTTAYTSFVLATAHRGTLAEGLAALLPCFWIYQRVGEVLALRGSPDPSYQAWIDAYADESFAAVVADYRALVDREQPRPDSAEAAAARENYRTAARYEWMFWDAAWRREQWPV